MADLKLKRRQNPDSCADADLAGASPEAGGHVHSELQEAQARARGRLARHTWEEEKLSE